MADKVREQGKQRRADARERRRSLAAKPFEEAEQAAEQDGEGAGAAAKKAVATAVAAALAGGLAGGAKALIDRHGRDEPQSGEDGSGPAPADESSEAPAAETDVDDQDVDETDVDDQDDDEQDDDEQDDDEQDGVEATDDAATGEAEDDGWSADEPADPPRGAPTGDVARIVRRAREQAAELLGSEVESVSGVERADGSWSVTLEVVELRRIPDTTDVLCSYDVVLDDDGNLVRLNQKRRYRRAQVEELS